MKRGTDGRLEMERNSDRNGRKVTSDCLATPYIAVRYQRQDLRQLKSSWRPVGDTDVAMTDKSVLTPDVMERFIQSGLL